MQSTKQKILIAAARLFRKQGYNGTYLSEIAKLVGIQPPSIYNHFASKQELLRDLLLQVANLFTKGMEEIAAANMSAEEKLKRLIALHVRLTVEQTDAVALIAGEWIHLAEVAIFIPALGLVGLHIYYRKYCQCQDCEVTDKKIVNHG